LFLTNSGGIGRVGTGISAQASNGSGRLFDRLNTEEDNLFLGQIFIPKLFGGGGQFSRYIKRTLLVSKNKL